jgi:sulfur-oxidizing protein SoxB
MFPVITNWLEADKEMESFISQMRQTKYTDKIIQSRRKDAFFTPAWVGKTYDEILTEKLAKADQLLYRRGNFMGTWDQVICNALRWEYKADVAMSAGVRWGTTTLEGDWITMDDVMSQVATTYSETYVSEMSGEQLMQTLEAVADNLFDPDPYLQSGGDMVRVGGMDYSIAPTKGLGERITDARLDNGDPIDPKKTYKVAGWATVNRTPDGRLIWDIIRDYILATKDSSDVLRVPKINHPKVIGMNDNPGMADYPGETA